MSRKKPQFGPIGGATYIYKKGVTPPRKKGTISSGIIVAAMSKNKKYS